MTEKPADLDAVLIDEELGAAERKALAAWEVSPAPRDLVSRAIAAARASRRATRSRRQSRALWLLAAGLAAAGILGAILWSSLRRESGSLVALQRTTAQLGLRALIVAETGAELSWSGRGNRLHVEQTAGNVFYRVERGNDAVEVETAAGTVRVLGTCFRVEVETMRASRAGVAGAAVGVAATLALVTVYEGRVLTASPRGQRELGAGQIGELRSDQPPRLAGELGGSGVEATGGSGADRRDNPSSPGATGSLVDENRQLRAERQRMQQELDGLRSQLQASKGKEGKMKFLNLDKEELGAMAKRCELRWDMPALESNVPTLDRRAVPELGLTDAEQAGINKGLSEYHKSMVRELRKLYIEITGDSKIVDRLSPSAMISEMEDKSRHDEIKAVFQRLSRERAGLQAPPADLSQASAAERVYRLVTGAGDRAEKLIGAEIGPDLARRYREAFDGFGSRSRSTPGCPGQSH